MTEKTIYIAPYVRTDGTQVRGHYRTINTDGTMWDFGSYNAEQDTPYWGDMRGPLPEKKGPTFPTDQPDFYVKIKLWIAHTMVTRKQGTACTRETAKQVI